MKKLLELILLFHSYIDQKRYFIDNMQYNAQRTPKRSRNVAKKKRNCLAVHKKLSR